MTIEEIKKLREETQKWLEQIEHQQSRYDFCVVCGIKPQTMQELLDYVDSLLARIEELEKKIDAWPEMRQTAYDAGFTSAELLYKK